MTERSYSQDGSYMELRNVSVSHLYPKNSLLLVSVIIPVYNVEPYLKESIESVLNQTYENLEIIIIDDGSTDGSGRVCDEYAKQDERIIVIHQDNRGLSAARNTGLDLMTGDIVAFLDSDDSYHPDFVETMLNVMIADKADIVICEYKICDSLSSLSIECKGRIRPLPGGYYDHISSLQALAEGRINISAWNKLYRRKLWNGIRFPVGYIYEDNATLFRIFDLSRSASIINKPLYYYRKHSKSITETRLIKSLPDLDIAFSLFESYISDNIPNIFTQEQLRRKRQSRLNRMIYCYIKDRGAGKPDRRNLRREILKIGKEVGIDTIEAKNRIYYQLIRFFGKL